MLARVNAVGVAVSAGTDVGFDLHRCRRRRVRRRPSGSVGNDESSSEEDSGFWGEANGDCSRPRATQTPNGNRFMNCRPLGNQAYVPTDVEHIANVITHGMCIVPSLFGLLFLMQQASDKNQYVNALIFGFALVALYSISTVFHSIFYLGRFNYLKEILHRCDRAIIYIFIAASYTPWLNVKEIVQGSWTSHFKWLVWIMAFLGIVYQQLYHERFKWLEITFYLIMALLPATALVQTQEVFGMKELILGGVAYMVGVVFFKSDGRIPCAHAIWHLFVGLGSLYHYFAICKYLMGKNNEPKYQILD